MSLPTRKKAIRVKTTDDRVLEIENFFNKLGLQQKPDIYLVDDLAYIQINILLPLLSVTPEWFVKNTELSTHHIKINGTIYANKYGIVLLIGKSKEAAARRLIDYMFEALYRLETNGSVAIADIDSRKKLVQTLTELSVYQTIDQQKDSMIKNTTEELNQLRTDYNLTDEELSKVRSENKSLSERCSLLENENHKLREISINLGKYVHCKTKNNSYHNSLTSTLEDIEELNETSFEDSYSADDTETLHREAQAAKQYLSKLNKVKNKKSYDKKLQDRYILRTTSMICDDDGTELFEWFIVDKLPTYTELTINFVTYKNFKSFSKDYALGGFDQTIYDKIWYDDITINELYEHLLNSLFRVLGYTSEKAVLELIRVIQQYSD